jgi:hypothetical protein
MVPHHDTSKKCETKSTKLLLEVFGFGGIADNNFSVLVETNYSAEYSAETGIRSTTNSAIENIDILGMLGTLALRKCLNAQISLKTDVLTRFKMF